jgi:hypothetical protein
VPRVSFPGQRLLRVCMDDWSEPECENPRDIPLAFIEGIERRLARNSEVSQT